MNHLGNVPAGSVLYIPFASYAGATGASVTMTGLAVTDIEIYKNGSVTQRASDNGYTLLDTDGTDFDGLTGIHGFSVDLSDNSDASFYSVGASYWVIVSSVTIDGQVVNFIAATFRICAAESIAGVPKADVAGWLGTAPSTPTVAGVPNVNAKTWNDLTTVELPLVPTIAGRKLDVSGGGEAGIDLANVGSPTTTLALTGTTISPAQKVDVETIKTNPVANGGTVTFPTNATLASTTNITAGTITTATNLTNNNDKTGYALSGAGVQAIWDALTSALTTVGSIGKRISDYLTGDAFARIGATAGASLSVDVAAVKVDTAAAKATALKLDTTLQNAGNSPGDYEFTADSLRHAPTGSGGSSGPSAAAIADAVWDEAIAGHAGAGSTGAALSAAGSAGDPWSTALPGAYAAGTAGYIVGNTIKASADRLLTMMEPAGGSPGEYKLTADALRAVISIVPTAIQNADALLDRDMAAGVDSGSTTVRTPRQAYRILRNRWVISGSTQSIKKEDDSTESWSQELTATPGADPVTATDPAG